MNDKVDISSVNLMSTYDNSEDHSELLEEVEQLVITDDMEDVEHDMVSIPVIKKCFNGKYHESVKKGKGKATCGVRPIPGYDMTCCHLTKEQSKKICVDSETGDLIKVENVLVEHTKESQHDEDYIEFFQANENGDGIIRNNKVLSDVVALDN